MVYKGGMSSRRRQMLEEFKTFAMRGNILDLAVGFTVGAAFTTIARSLVDDVLMPPIGLVFGRVDFADLYLLLRAGREPLPENATLAQAQDLGAVTLNYGRFLNSVVTFLLVAAAMFLILRFVRKIDTELDERLGGRASSADAPANKKCAYCRSVVDVQATRCPHCTSELEADTMTIECGPVED